MTLQYRAAVSVCIPYIRVILTMDYGEAGDGLGGVG